MYQVLLVTGGYDGNGEGSSTEVYYPSAGEWTQVGDLPGQRFQVSAVTLNNKVLTLGEMLFLMLFYSIKCLFFKGYADILEYSEVEEGWTRIAQMSTSKSSHAVSIVDYDNFKDHCRESARSSSCAIRLITYPMLTIGFIILYSTRLCFGAFEMLTKIK